MKAATGGLDCSSNGAQQTGDCGPTLIRFKERQPPLLHALGAPGWQLDRWESVMHEPDGTTKRRAGPMPDGSLYLNGFGYTDTGELETVTAVFAHSRPDVDDRRGL